VLEKMDRINRIPSGLTGTEPALPHQRDNEKNPVNPATIL
jgi:hypothetical protein